MRKMRFLLLFVAFFGILAGFLAYAEEVSTDAALQERLVSGSPWSGTHDTKRGINGDLEIVFKKDGGKFVGAVTKFTNIPASSQEGKVSYLKVEKGMVSFQHIGGGDFYLSLNEKGELVGSGHARMSGGQIKTDITLRSSR